MYRAWYEHFLRNRTGFTAVELILTLGIFAILAAVSAPLLGNLQITETLDSHAENVIDALRRAQQRTLTGERNQRWGVRCSTNTYTLFAGDTYASRLVQFDELHTFQGGYTCLGITEVTFAPITGKPTTTGYFSVAHPSTGTRSIVIGPAGELLLE